MSLKVKEILLFTGDWNGWSRIHYKDGIKDMQEVEHGVLVLQGDRYSLKCWPLIKEVIYFTDAELAEQKKREKPSTPKRSKKSSRKDAAAAA